MVKPCEGNVVIYCIASESCALDSVDAEFEKFTAGNLVVDENGIRSIKTHCGENLPYVYLSLFISQGLTPLWRRYSPEGKIKTGILREEHPVDADVVIGVPDSGLDATLGLPMHQEFHTE